MQSMGAVGERGAQDLDVFFLAQRRVHLAGGAVAHHRLVGEEEVMGCHLGGHRQTA